ncbi:hypothetical protein Vadar_008650 [Vaccinium darrowii]|uniref:Uncharacterized protein n=1 Tax=Vaccinium darrowii TaxID=229202 RepID=A0ACB7XG42_9ERIC|nr:hypothetical protein Vadar_008650 [Vaccinium darrowii]
MERVDESTEILSKSPVTVNSTGRALIAFNDRNVVPFNPPHVEYGGGSTRQILESQILFGSGKVTSLNRNCFSLSISNPFGLSSIHPIPRAISLNGPPSPQESHVSSRSIPNSISISSSPKSSNSVNILSSTVKKRVPVYEEKRTHKTYQVVDVKSLYPKPYCIESTRDQSKRETLKVVHRHGPCSHLNEDQASTPTLTEITSIDQSRVDSIQKRLRINSDGNGLKGSKATLPAKSGRLIGTGNYIVTLGFGTPKKDLTLVFDTGSDITWIQCEPCISCYPQQEPVFNPSTSQTYKNLTCNSQQCSQLQLRDCFTDTNTCIYGVDYGDGSFTRGFFATETLILIPSDVFPNFFFGCGVKNGGLFRGLAGLLGLSPDPLSLIRQTASKYGNYFSYCLPTFSSSSGTLVFGKEGGPTNSASLKFTPLSINSINSNGPSFYFIEVNAIKVGEQTLSISPSVFSNSGTVIDSGTVVTRLQPEAYSALRTSFRQQMMNYTMTQGVSLFDTCYDFSGHDTVVFPEITFVFGGNVEVPIDPSGILIGTSQTQACLAFAGNRDASEVGIFGNLQQQTLDVVYDVAGGKLGFGTGGCS